MQLDVLHFQLGDLSDQGFSCNDQISEMTKGFSGNKRLTHTSMYKRLTKWNNVVDDCYR